MAEAADSRRLSVAHPRSVAAVERWARERLFFVPLVDHCRAVPVVERGTQEMSSSVVSVMSACPERSRRVVEDSGAVFGAPLDTLGGLRVRRYGGSGPLVIVLHGGPAAAGEAAPIARGLADSFRVIEPWQRGSGGEPLTVARHVADLHDLIRTQGDIVKPALVGESWGAMLTLAYAAAHPDAAGPLALVACGTFDKASRARITETLEERTDRDLRERLEALAAEIPDPDERLKRRYDLLSPLYDYSTIPEDGCDDDVAEPFDARAHTETWNDMVRLQEQGVYPAAFEAITSPVLMLHGAYDPHPGQMIRASFEPYIPHLEYREWERCGHRPWAEKYVRDEFFAALRDWLLEHTT